MSQRQRSPWCFLALCSLPWLVSCGGSGPGEIRGTVTYAGPDTGKPISMQGDPACASLHPAPVYSGETALRGGKLANVFVYVKRGLEGKSFPAPVEKKRVDQRGCLYVPRVLGVQVGQAVEFANGDATLHTVHAAPAANAEFNEPQTEGAPPVHRTFSKPEVMVRVRCDIHPWMIAWVGVLPHSYYAVSGEDGGFAIPDLPPGRYTLEAWHETLGTRTREVTVAPGRATTVGFDFNPKP